MRIMLPGLLVALLLSPCMAAGAAALRPLRVAVHTYPPYMIAGAEPAGFAHDLVERIATARGFAVRYIEVRNPAEALALIAAGEADMHPFLAPNDSRRAVVSFTRPYDWIHFAVYVRQNRAADALAPGARAAMTFGATRGTVADSILSAMPDVGKRRYDDNSALLVALASGEIDGAVYGVTAFQSLARVLGVESRFVRLDEPMPALPVSFAVSNAAPELLRELDEALVPVMAAAQFVAAKDRWFGAAPPFWDRERILIWGGMAFAALAAAMLASLVRVRELERRRRLAESIRQGAKLAAANLDLERKNEEMRRLIYMVSHDLNSPLASIGGFVRRLSRGMAIGDAAIMRDSAERIGRNAVTMRRLLDGVLVLNRAASDALHLEELTPRQLAGAVRDALAAPLLAARATLVVEIDAPTLICDSLLITQSVQNLVENALKHGCPAPGMTVLLRVARCASGVRIEVADQGPGVPEASRDEVFRPFIRGPEARLSGKEGLGIGLATVRAVVEKHHGRLWVEDVAQGGARFVLELPADQVPLRIAASPTIREDV